MPQLHAQPYDITANGFYFESLEEYADKASNNRNDYGDPVEEYEIQFIDGDHIDCDLAKAWRINQANIGPYFEACESWGDHDKTVFIIAVGEAGYSFDPDSVSLMSIRAHSITHDPEPAVEFAGKRNPFNRTRPWPWFL